MKRVFTVVGVAIAFVLTMWALSNIFVVFFASRLPKSELSDLGAVGDTFGVVTSLFSGLGAIGIVAVIAIEQRSRKLNQQPFLTLDPLKAIVSSANFDDGVARFELNLNCEINNATSDPCLNPRFSFTAKDGLTSRHEIPNSPIVAGNTSEQRIILSAVGPEATKVFQDLAQNEPLAVDVSVTYSSLNGTMWRTKAKLLITAGNGDNSARFRKIFEREKEQYILKPTLARKDQISLDVNYEADSWKHTELVLPRRAK